MRDGAVGMCGGVLCVHAHGVWSSAGGRGRGPRMRRSENVEIVFSDCFFTLASIAGV